MMKKSVIAIVLVAASISAAQAADTQAQVAQNNIEHAARALQAAQHKLDFDKGRGADQGTIAADIQDRDEVLSRIEGLTGKHMTGYPQVPSNPRTIGEAF